MDESRKAPRIEVQDIHSGWESWSKKDKQELMAEAEQGGEVTRILHQGDWFKRIKEALDLQ